MERTCIATRVKGPQHDFLRLVLVPSDEGQQVLVDWAKKCPGRGAWITPTEAALRQAVKRNALNRAFKMPVKVDADHLVGLVQCGLVTQLRQRLSLARRAGVVQEGEGRASESVRDDRSRLLILASDISEKNAEKFRRNAERKSLRVAVSVDGATLGACFGRDFCSLVSIEGEPFATQIARLSRQFREFHAE